MSLHTFHPPSCVPNQNKHSSTHTHTVCTSIPQMHLKTSQHMSTEIRSTFLFLYVCMCGAGVREGKGREGNDIILWIDVRQRHREKRHFLPRYWCKANEGLETLGESIHIWLKQGLFCACWFCEYEASFTHVHCSLWWHALHLHASVSKYVCLLHN